MMSIRGASVALVRKALAAFGIHVERRQAANGPALPVLPLVLKFFYDQDGPGTLVQVGANDGVRGDPVRWAILRHHFPALLVEPLPDLYEKLRANYASEPQVRFANVAVGEEPGEAVMYRLPHDVPSLPDWAQGLASFDKRLLLEHRKLSGLNNVDLERLLVTARVPVVTMTQLLAAEPGISAVLALQVDTEGHDLHVIRSALHGGIRPRIINYEHKHLSYANQEACRDLLAKSGYAFVSTREDTLAVRDAQE